MFKTICNKTIKVILIVTLLLTYGVYPSYALPQGAIVQEGTADFDNPDVNTMDITTSDQAIIDYTSFNIAGGETVNFIQPSADSICLNRVTGAGGSEIFGSLNANGQIFLVNSNGILFGAGSSVNVGGIIASTADITNADFLAGDYNFDLDSFAGITNAGEITASNYAALLSHNITNSGDIIVPAGKIEIASAPYYTVDISGKDLISIGISGQITENPDELDDQFHNTGTGVLQADSGRIYIQSDSARELFLNAVNNEGIIQANTCVEGEDGSIYFTTNDRLHNSGTLESSETIVADVQGISSFGSVITPYADFSANEEYSDYSGVLVRFLCYGIDHLIHLG